MNHTQDAALVVDLDGTLIHTDLLIESTFVLARKSPGDLIRLPGWLRHGKATFKDKIAKHAELDIANLPYNNELLEYLTAEKQQGRRVILATAANRRYADQVAGHLQVFDHVLASDAHTNLSGQNKLSAIQKLLGRNTPFDYAADHDDDRSIWSAARQSILVGASSNTQRWAYNKTRVGKCIDGNSGGLRTWIKAMRVHQWSKNLLIFLPLLAGHNIMDGHVLLTALLAFIAYGALSSSVYLLNDLIDLGDDRRHPTKQYRPFASGQLPVAQGIVTIPILILLSAAIALFLPPLFAGVLAVYYVMTLSYSLGLKRVVLIDVLTLAGLYTLRVIAGGVATGVLLSFWLLAWSMSIFLSLAMAKRCAELRLMQDGRTDGSGRGYKASDQNAIESLGTAAGYASVVILALYINSPVIIQHYTHPTLIWGLCPIVLYWISHIWLQTMRGHMTDDPIIFAARDTSSRICIMLGILIVVAASL